MLKGWLIHRTLFGFLLVFSLGMIEVGCGGGGASDPTDPPCSTCPVVGSGTIPVVAHVFVLVEENHSYHQVIGNGAMPYTNMLAQKYSLATQYYANRFNSLPNYFMLTVGNLITTNDLYTGTVTADNVARAVTKAGKSWKVYAESLPNIGYLGPSQFPYGKDHNPFTYFSDVLNSASQAANVVPFTQLATDLKNGTLPDYAMVVPDFANDGHDCPPAMSSCTDTQKLANIDNWVSKNVGPLIQSPAFQNSLLIYTWDESVITDLTNRGGHVATILVSPKVR